MEKEFMPYEEALALKELGFNELCICIWNREKALKSSISEPSGRTNSVRLVFNNGKIPAPLYQQAFRFFREDYKLEGWVVPSYCDKGRLYSYIIDTIGGHEWEDGCEDFVKYEEAELACLRKLIEIAKNK